MKSCAIINAATEWPHRNQVTKSVETTLCQIYLNKLWIPDVLIDIIKDYLYISAEEILRKFNKSAINASIEHLSCDSCHYVDVFGRRRLTTWTIGHIYYPKQEVQLQQTLCVTCGEKCEVHTNVNGWCELEWDGEEDGTLELEFDISEAATTWFSEAAAGLSEAIYEDDDEYVDEADRYDYWNPFASYSPDDIPWEEDEQTTDLCYQSD